MAFNIPFWVYAQLPVLPGANLRITNMQDGKTKPPGWWYYIQLIQNYQAGSIKNGVGKTDPAEPLTSSILLLQQKLYVSNQKVLGGKLKNLLLYKRAHNRVIKKMLFISEVNPKSWTKTFGVYYLWQTHI